MIKKLHHVGIAVNKLKESVAFYEHLLGVLIQLVQCEK
jgi:catechol 2,3-dioxygenase-like lactoylglutathione lyase family enzyme